VGSPDDLPLLRFPAVEAAARDLASRQVLTRADFDRLADDAKAAAFTVARVTSLDALAKIQAALVDDVARGGTLADFRRAVDDALGSSALTPAHIENVYRTNVAQAYTQGQAEVLAHPLVADEFPYLAYHACHDARVRADHLRLETWGLSGTNVYRRDDPIWERFLPPWDYQCRCVVVPLTLADAARAGVREAQEWLRTGIPPALRAWVKPPPFEPPAGWTRRNRLEALI